MLLLSWEEVTIQYENLVKFAAKNSYMSRHSVDNAIGTDDLYQIGMQKLFECWSRYNHLPMDEFKYVFSTTLFRATRRELKPLRTVELNPTVDYEPVVEDFTETLVVNESLQELRLKLT